MTSFPKFPNSQKEKKKEGEAGDPSMHQGDVCFFFFVSHAAKIRSA